MKNINLQWLASEQYLSLDKTNVRMSGNIKCVLCQNGTIGFETIDSTSDLSSLEYKGFVCNKSEGYLTNLQRFCNKFKSLNQMYDVIPIVTSTTKFIEQYNTIYNYGAYRQQNDLLQKHSIRFFAPLWTYKILPTRFVILQLNSDSFIHEQMFNNGMIVASFDLSRNSDYGKFIYTLLDNQNFKKSCCETDLENGFGWTGIDPYTGYIHTAYEHNIESYLANERTLLEQDNAISNGWMRNGIICQNLLNLEFAFSDENAKYGYNTYIGFYCNEQEYDELIHKSENALIVSETSEAIKRYAPINTSNTELNTPLNDVLHHIGTSNHIVDNQIGLPDPIMWMHFNTTPQVDTRIQIWQKQNLLFEYVIDKSDVTASSESKIFDNICTHIDEASINMLGVYSEHFNNNLILYIPSYNPDKYELTIEVPYNAVLNKSTSGAIIFNPYLRDALVTKTFNNAEFIKIDNVDYEIIDTYKMYDGLAYIRTDIPQEILDEQKYINFYSVEHPKTKVLIPISHGQFYIENEDPHTELDFNTISDAYGKRMTEIFYKYQFWNVEKFNEFKAKYSVLPNNIFTDNSVSKDDFPNGLQKSYEEIKELIATAAVQDKYGHFIKGINQTTGVAYRFDAGNDDNPYNRFDENNSDYSKNLNKTYPFIIRFANPFGIDATNNPYLNNIALQYGVSNFCPDIKQIRTEEALTHSWYLIEGKDFNFFEDSRFTELTISNSIPSEWYIIDEHGQLCKLFVKNGQIFDTITTEDLSERKLAIKRNGKYFRQVVIDYASIFKSTKNDAYNQLKIQNTKNGLFFDTYAWTTIEKITNTDTRYRAFFKGVEYDFEGNFDNYRFSVILITSINSEKPFELIDNTVFKTLTLIIYNKISAYNLTTLNGKIPYTFDQIFLYYANKTYADNLSIIDYTSEFGTKIGCNFRNLIKPKNITGASPKIHIKTSIKHELKEFDVYPYFYFDQFEVINDKLIPTTKITPLFCISSEKDTDFTKLATSGKSMSWNFVKTFVSLDDSSTRDYKVVRITAQRIHYVNQECIWCEDITVEPYPEGTPFVSGNQSLWELIDEGFSNISEHTFYKELCSFGNDSQTVWYDGQYETLVPTLTSYKVRSLKHDFWFRIDKNIDLENSTNNWLKRFTYTIDENTFFSFNDNAEEYLKLFVVDHIANKYIDTDFENLVTSLFDYSNFWTQCNELSKNSSIIFKSIEGSIQRMYENLSFGILSKKIESTPIDLTRISKNSREEQIEELYKKKLGISKPVNTMIISSLYYDNESIVRGKRFKFPITRYKFDYAPLFERILVPMSDTTNIPPYIPTVFNNRKLYAKQVAVYHEELSTVYDDLTLNATSGDNPYRTMNDGEYAIPFVMSPTPLRNYVSKIFSYNTSFDVEIENYTKPMSILSKLYEIFSDKVFTQAMLSDYEQMTKDAVCAAVKPDVHDILPSNIDIEYNIIELAFKRFYRDCFLNQYKCKQCIDNNGNKIDFSIDNDILILTGSYTGNLTLTFEQI